MVTLATRLQAANEQFEETYGLSFLDYFDADEMKQKLNDYRSEMLAMGQNQWPDKEKIIAEIVYDTRHKEASKEYEDWHQEKYGTSVTHLMGFYLSPKNRKDLMESMSTEIDFKPI